MNYFRYKQFNKSNKDVITVAVGYYLRYALSYRDISEILRNVVLTFIIQRSTVGFKNMPQFYIKFGRKSIKSLLQMAY
jgi:transposase-like protein